MRQTISLLVAATALAGCAWMPFGHKEADTPSVAAAPSVAATPAPAVTAAMPQAYEIKDASRGMVRRVRVLLNGRTVDTLVMSRRREASSSYCCTPDRCEEIAAKAACSTFKMTCDKDGACARVSSGKSL